MAGKIFISYRRRKTAWAARALFERLRREFDDRVFIDIEGLSLGIDFTKLIDAHLEECEVMLAVIGQDWLPEIQRRADSSLAAANPSEPDWVCAEISRALARGIPVVPVLIDGASPPAKSELPTELRGLSSRQGIELHPHLFDDQTGRLVREITKIISATQAFRSLPTNERTGKHDARRPDQVSQRPSWIKKEGADAFGFWAEFQVMGVEQRLRWIAPGDFWMGSPHAEIDRNPDEQRQRFTHDRGFWLAETTCTQALWRAVLDDNPSKFTGNALHPVERVSWNSIYERFLPELNRLVPELEATLPTEAQWEYACRAGTQTPFSFGETVTSAQTNFDGNHPYGGATKGEYRKTTVPVKSLPPNAWGLFEMHGNVWEWCADEHFPDLTDDATTRTGPGGLVSRLLRGGSWLSPAKCLRSAHRYHYLPDGAFGDFGFRLCIASGIEPLPINAAQRALTELG